MTPRMSLVSRNAEGTLQAVFPGRVLFRAAAARVSGGARARGFGRVPKRDVTLRRRRESLYCTRVRRVGRAHATAILIERNAYVSIEFAVSCWNAPRRVCRDEVRRCPRF